MGHIVTLHRVESFYFVLCVCVRACMSMRVRAILSNSIGGKYFTYAGKHFCVFGNEHWREPSTQITQPTPLSTSDHRGY